MGNAMRTIPLFRQREGMLPKSRKCPMHSQRARTRPLAEHPVPPAVLYLRISD